MGDFRLTYLAALFRETVSRCTISKHLEENRSDYWLACARFSYSIVGTYTGNKQSENQTRSIAFFASLFTAGRLKQDLISTGFLVS